MQSLTSQVTQGSQEVNVFNQVADGRMMHDPSNVDFDGSSLKTKKPASQFQETSACAIHLPDFHSFFYDLGRIFTEDKPSS